MADVQDAVGEVGRRNMASAWDQERSMPPTSRVTKTNFAMLCGQTELVRDFGIEDPNSELALADSTWCEDKVFSKEMMCNDTFLNVTLSEDPVERLREMKQSLDTFKVGGKSADEWEVVEKVGDRNCALLETQGGLTKEDAQGCIWALSFYTGSNYTKAVRSASLAFRQNNLVHQAGWDEDKVANFKRRMGPVSYYLVRALCVLPAYWGVITRCGDLGADDLSLYMPGHLVTWFQWSSCKKGSGAASAFAGKNTRFIIWSIAGRHIDDFSNFGKNCGGREDEVLLLPGSRFLVLKVEQDEGGKTTIHMRQVELGITKGLPLLWVDDHILNPNKEMKLEMDMAQVRRQQDHVIKFILKESTDLALAFLRSPWGRCHSSNDESNLRILSDMGRPKEEDGHRAGGHLVKAITTDLVSEGLVFDCNILIFTSSVSKGQSVLNELDVEGRVGITATPSVATRFAAFGAE